MGERGPVARALEMSADFCSIQVLRGEPYSEKCDVWSFGVLPIHPHMPFLTSIFHLNFEIAPCPRPPSFYPLLSVPEITLCPSC